MARATPRLRDLPDVDGPSFADGEVPVFSTGTGKFSGQAAGGGGGDLTGAVILAPPTSARNVIVPTLAIVIPLTVKQAAAQTADTFKVVDSTEVELVRLGGGGLNQQVGNAALCFVVTGRDDDNSGLLGTVSHDGAHELSMTAVAAASVGAGPHLILDVATGRPLSEYWYTEIVHKRDGLHKHTQGVESFGSGEEHYFFGPVHSDILGVLDYSFTFTTDIATGRTIFNPDVGAVPATYVALVEMRGSDAAVPLLKIKAAVAQSADLFDIRDSSDAVLSRINKAGYFMTRKAVAPADGDLAASELAVWFDSTNGAAKAMFKGKSANGTVVSFSLDGVDKQPLNADLTAIAALAPGNDDVVQRKAGAWTNRTPAQVKTDLVLVKGDVGLGSADNTADTAKPVSTAQQTALDGRISVASFLAYAPSGAKAASHPNRDWTLADLNGVLASGRLHLVGGSPTLSAGTVVNSISFMTGSAGAVTPTHQWFCLIDQAANVLAKTVDDTTVAWASDTIKTLSFASPYTLLTNVVPYLGLLITAGTVPRFRGTTLALTAVGGAAPAKTQSAQSGLTDPASLGATATGLAGHTLVPWCWIS